MNFLDEFGDLPGTAATGRLSGAQRAARRCREHGCRLLLPVAGRCAPAPPPMLSAASAARLLCDMVTTAQLAHDDLSQLTSVRAALRAARSQRESALDVPGARAELAAACALYNSFAAATTAEAGGGDAAGGKDAVAARALWGRSLAFVAEMYFGESERHYVRTLELARRTLVQAVSLSSSSSSSSLGHRELFRAHEALGRVLLLQARYALYNEKPGAEALLGEAAEALHAAGAAAVLLQDGEYDACTFLYDTARVAALLGDGAECQRVLEQASLPPSSVLRVEPDFAIVRSSEWFRELVASCVAAEEGRRQQPGSSGDDSYAQLVASLRTEGIGFSPQRDACLRFPLYMGHPCGPLPASILGAAEVEMAKEARSAAGMKRLQDRLQQLHLREKRAVPSDGNCQFLAISDQLSDSFEMAPALRREAVSWLRAHDDWPLENGASLRDFVPDGWSAYCDQMARNGVWGDHLTLVALAEVLGARISVLSSVEGDNFLTEIAPRDTLHLKVKRVLLLSHFAEFHYGSLAYA